MLYFEQMSINRTNILRMTLSDNLTLMISVLKNQLAFSKQITPCLDLSGGSTTQNQHGLSSRRVASRRCTGLSRHSSGIQSFRRMDRHSELMGLALILYPLFVFSHQSFNDDDDVFSEHFS